MVDVRLDKDGYWEVKLDDDEMKFLMMGDGSEIEGVINEVCEVFRKKFKKDWKRMLKEMGLDDLDEMEIKIIGG